ncbi:hypothetical protein RB213_001005, partial [Colletotrichum asianum]
VSDDGHDGGGGSSAIFVAGVADRDERWHSRRGMVTAAWVHPICDRFRTAKRWSPTRMRAIVPGADQIGDTGLDVEECSSEAASQGARQPHILV